MCNVILCIFFHRYWHWYITFVLFVLYAVARECFRDKSKACLSKHTPCTYVSNFECTVSQMIFNPTAKKPEAYLYPELTCARIVAVYFLVYIQNKGYLQKTNNTWRHQIYLSVLYVWLKSVVMLSGMTF